ncbi:hypothetical protein LAL4801_05788 [Roseibium aggregatum]|uniref:Uncharacterized protein n=2 Tax=Roseibium aggregatum TaxID=187304 RepID=A0A0M6YB57_9HYPH|nr:hypothetical protein LAL4801_05788 [Roseibium aggregatum]
MNTAATNEDLPHLPAKRLAESCLRLTGPEMSSWLEGNVASFLTEARAFNEAHGGASDSINDDSAKYILDDPEDGAEVPAPPALGIMGEAGAGKTRHTATALVNHASDLKTGYNGDSVRQMREFEEFTSGIGGEIELYLGREQFSKDGEPMCLRQDVAAAVAQRGLNVRETACVRTEFDKATGKKVERKCPFFDQCQYNKQFERAEKAKIVAGSHQFLKFENKAMAKIDMLVIDEASWSVNIGETTIDLAAFMTHRAIGSNGMNRNYHAESRSEFEERQAETEVVLNQAIDAFRSAFNKAHKERRFPSLKDFRETELTPEWCESAARAEYTRKKTPDIYPDMADDDVLDLLSKLEFDQIAGFARTWRVLAAEMRARPEGDSPVQGFEFLSNIARAHSDGVRLQLGMKVHYRTKPKHYDKPTLVLDGDADPIIMNKFYPHMKFVQARGKWPNCPVYQQVSKTGSKYSFETSKTALDDVRAAILALVDRHRAEFERDPARRIVIVMQKFMEDKLREEGFIPAEGTPEYDQCGFAVMHFGATRGIDAHSKAAALMVVGRMEPAVDDVESMGRKIYGDDVEPLRFIQPDKNGMKQFPRQEVIVRDKRGSTAKVMVSYHPDPRCDALLRQVRDAELYQAIMRIRPLWGNGEIIMLTNVPLPIEVARISTWAELVPDQFDRSVRRGILFDNFRDMAEANPDLFASHAALRQSWKRRPGRVFASDLEALMAATIKEEECEGWMRIRFRRAGAGGKRMTWRSAWIRAEKAGRLADLEANLSNRLSGVSDLEIVEMVAPAVDNVVEFPCPDREQLKKELRQAAFHAVVPERMKSTMYELGAVATPF